MLLPTTARHARWFVNATLVTPTGLHRGAVAVRDGRIAEIRAVAPRGGERIDVRGQYIAPGFIDLHVWGDAERVARVAVAGGTTAFLTAIGPTPPEELVNRLARLRATPERARREETGAHCLGAHLEGPFLNAQRAGALPPKWMRPPLAQELRQLQPQAARIKLVTLAPELPGAVEAIRWFRRRRITVSLGHTNTDAHAALCAMRAGATGVTHLFNGMPPFHHRDPGVAGLVLTEPRLSAMMILDGVHVHPRAFELVWRCKGREGIVLVTDSIAQQRLSRAALKGGAYYTRGGVLAGSRLTMIEAVRNAVNFGKIALPDAVRLATWNPARLIGQDRQRGSLDVGQRADLVVFDRHFRVHTTIVGGHIVYQRSSAE